jgi:hypothetical protein
MAKVFCVWTVNYKSMTKAIYDDKMAQFIVFIEKKGAKLAILFLFNCKNGSNKFKMFFGEIPKNV